MQKLQFKTRTVYVLLLVLFPFMSNGQWINEIHYDDSGGDSNEGVEIAAPSGTDLSCFELIPYNGNGGTSYSITSLSGIVPDEGCGYGAIWFPISGLQNGAPDGIALYNTCTSSIIEFLSYEGSFTATNGNASGSTSTDIGVSEAGSTTGSSLQLTGSGSASSDFTWQAEGPASSEGLLNAGQSISPCGASNTITTGLVATSPFDVDCTNSTTASGTVAFTSTGTFTAGNIYSAEISDETGSFASPTVIGTITSTANSGSINITIPSTFISGSGYLIRIISDSPATTGTSSTAFTINQIDPCVPNSITTGAITGAPFTVDCAGTDDTGTIDFTSLGVYTAGNIYSAEMSDASGSFASPIVIGTLSSTANSGSISITIPAATATGAGYLIRIVSDSPATTGTTSATFSVNQIGSCVLEPPHLTSVYINSCNTTCNEGYNEIVFGTSGDYSINVTSSNFNFEYGSNPSPASNTNYTDVLVNNTTSINALNTASGCPGLFIDATNTVIPQNASWMLAYTDICEEALDWSGLCGSGPIYVIFQDDPDWNTGGNFANNTAGTRYLNTNITTTSSDNFDIDYNFDGSAYSNSDGVFAQYDSNGGAPILYGDDDCILTPVLLPVELSSFTGKNDYNNNVLNWTTESERNSMNFELQRSNDGKTWETIHTAVAAENSLITIDYTHIDYDFPLVVNYYRLKQNDLNGASYTYNKFIAIDNSNQREAKVVKIVNILGQEIKSDTKGLQIHIYDNGTSVKTFK